MNTLQFEASQVLISEAKSNDIYMSVLMRMFSTRVNRNGCAVTEAFMDKILNNAQKYTCLPLCADASLLRRGQIDGLGHMLEDDGFKSEQIGSFFSFVKTEDEFGISLLGEARIPKRDEELCKTIRKMHEIGQLAFSFEIVANDVFKQDGVTVIDAAEGNELIGMAVVSVPAYPEATALKLVAEEKNKKGAKDMEETIKKLAEAEVRLKLAEEKALEDSKELEKKNEELEKKDEELKSKEEELEAEKKKCEGAESGKDATNEQLCEKDAKIKELEAKIEELMVFKEELDAIKEEQLASEMDAKKLELTEFAKKLGLDIEDELVKKAIEEINYEALVTEAMKLDKNSEDCQKPTVASYAMSNGMSVCGMYDELLCRG